MDAWFTKNLGDPMLAGDLLDRITALFRAAHEAAEDPEAMAVFIRHESEGRLHCEIKAYFSPAAAAVARAVGALPCKRPAPDGLDLLAGSEDSRGALFPSETR